MTFSSLGLEASLLKAVEALGYDSPTPIQLQAIPEILAGHDLMAAAQTGTGKTAGFTLPLLQRLMAGKPARRGQARALILTPTRELASQVAQSVTDYSQYLDLRSAVVFGGVKIGPQISRLQCGVDVLTATPGRLLDLYQQKVINFSDLEVLVLDEADRMLDMGFIRDIRKILAYLPKQRQNLMFSATFSGDIRKLAQGILHQPVSVEVAARNVAADTVEQWAHPVSKRGKTSLLCHLFQRHDWQQVLVFTRTKHGANRLAQKLERSGVSSAVIHGNKSQNARTRALADFKAGKVRALVATDIAARGLDIAELPHVVNFELPNVPEDYVHRIGRTGRAGSEGQAVSLVSDDEIKLLRGIERLIGLKIEQRRVEGFEPVQESSDADARPPRRQQRRKPADSDEAGQQRRRRRRSGQGRQDSRHSPEGRERTAPSQAQKEGAPAGHSKPKRARRSGNRSDEGDKRKAAPMSEAAMHQAKADSDLEARRQREQRRIQGILQPKAQQPRNGRSRPNRGQGTQGSGSANSNPNPSNQEPRRSSRGRRRKPKQQNWSDGIGPLV